MKSIYSFIPDPRPAVLLAQYAVVPVVFVSEVWHF